MPVPKGTRVGGRQKGTPNKATAAKAAEIASSGLTPLDYMMKVLRDTGEDPARRLDAAKSAAPYVHARLASVDAKLTGDLGVTVEIVRFSK